MSESSMVAIQILRAIVNQVRLSPEMIALEVGSSNQYISNILGVLNEIELVQRPKTHRGPVRGIYEATGGGKLWNHYLMLPQDIKDKFIEQATHLLIQLSQGLGESKK